jgi:acetylornithine/N-succinyldiaminopimelate aminotransferase
VAKPAFLQQARETGDYLRARLERIARTHGLGAVRGRGLLLALCLAEQNAPAIVADAMERGLLLNAPRPDVLRFMPALNVTREEVDTMCTLLEEALVSQAACMAK